MAGTTTSTFKVYNADEIRRLVVSFASDNTTEQFAAFTAKTTEVFPDEDLVFKWKDSDGDLITIATVDDFAEAVRSQPSGPIRLHAAAPRAKSGVTPAPTSVPTPTLAAVPDELPGPPKEEATPPPPQPPPPPPKHKPVTHPFVVCDGTNQPLKGTRYHKIGADYDLCEEEFAQLQEPEKQHYEIILYPGAPRLPYEPVIHYGVICDSSNFGPIIGCRFHKIGENYDLSQPEFAKLDEKEKRRYELIVHPRTPPVPYKRPEQQGDADAATAAGAEPEMPDFLRMLHAVLNDGIIDAAILTHLPNGKGCGPCGRGPCGRNGPHHGTGPHHGKGPHHQGRCSPGGGGDGLIRRQEVSAGKGLPTGTFGHGSFGPGIEQLQRFLISNGLLEPMAIAWRAGIYGPKTHRAVANFQRTNGVPTDHIGRFNNATRTALLALTEVTSPGDEIKTESVPAAAPTTPTAPSKQQEPQPTPATTPPVASPMEPSNSTVPARWVDEIQVLGQMGFTNHELLSDILDTNEGSVQETVAKMLASARA